MNDILGSKIERKVGRLLSANFLKVRTPGGQISLGAEGQGSYSRALTPTEVFGSQTIYFTVGPSSGNIGIGSLIGEQGFFQAAQGATDPCSMVSLSVDGRGRCASDGNFSISDAILQGVGFGWSAGSTPVRDNVSFLFGSLS